MKLFPIVEFKPIAVVAIHFHDGRKISASGEAPPLLQKP
jgi:hypothetical protein